MKKKILLIEDDLNFRTVLTQALEKTDFQVEDTITLFEALEKISESVDLIIYDMTYSHFHSIADEILACTTGQAVPETNYQNGIGLLEAVRNRGYQTKFLFLCNRITRFDYSIAKLYGSIIFMDKPFKVDQIVSFVDDWLNIEIPKVSELLTD